MTTNRVIFETERLIVRLFNSNDKESFFLINGDEEIVRYVRPVKSKQECDAFLEEMIEYSNKHPLLGRWAVDNKITGKTIGMYSIRPFDDSHKIQMGYSFLKDFWGKGYSTELVKHGIQYCFDILGKKEVYALTETENIASQKVLIKVGFQIERIYPKENYQVQEWVFREG